jgi:hypothetical protein
MRSFQQGARSRDGSSGATADKKTPRFASFLAALNPFVPFIHLFGSFLEGPENGPGKEIAGKLASSTKNFVDNYEMLRITLGTS